MTEGHSTNEHLSPGIKGAWKWIIVTAFLVLAVIVTLYVLRPDFLNPSSSTQSPVASPAIPLISPVLPTLGAGDEDKNLSRLYEIGLKQFEAGEYLQAMGSYNAALAISPNSVDVLNARGNVYLATGDIENALQDYNKAIELDSSFGTAYYNRGRARLEKKDYQGALDDFSRVIATTPHLAYAAMVNRGVVYFKMGNYAQAIQEYNAAIDADPNQALAYLNRATTLTELGDFVGAVENYKRAREIDDRLSAAYWGEGWAYYKLKDYDASIAATQKAIRLVPKKATLYFNLGLAQLAGNYIKDAKASYQTGLQFATGDEKKQAIVDLEALKESKPERASSVEQIIESLK